MKGIDPAIQKQRKAEVRTLAQRSAEQGGFLGKRLRVGERSFGKDATPSMVFEDEAGQVFGVIPKKNAPDWLVGEQVVIRQAKGSDGNLSAMVERVDVLCSGSQLRSTDGSCTLKVHNSL